MERFLSLLALHYHIYLLFTKSAILKKQEKQPMKGACAGRGSKIFYIPPLPLLSSMSFLDDQRAKRNGLVFTDDLSTSVLIKITFCYPLKISSPCFYSAQLRSVIR